jgi:hypothetical protein
MDQEKARRLLAAMLKTFPEEAEGLSPAEAGVGAARDHRRRD